MTGSRTTRTAISVALFTLPLLRCRFFIFLSLALPSLHAIDIFSLDPVLVPCFHHFLLLSLIRWFMHLCAHENIALPIKERHVHRFVDGFSLDDLRLKQFPGIRSLALTEVADDLLGGLSSDALGCRKASQDG